MVRWQKLIFRVIEQEKEMLLHRWKVCLRAALKFSLCELLKGRGRLWQSPDCDCKLFAPSAALKGISRSLQASLDGICAGCVEYFFQLCSVIGA